MKLLVILASLLIFAPFVAARAQAPSPQGISAANQQMLMDALRAEQTALARDADAQTQIRNLEAQNKQLQDSLGKLREKDAKAEPKPAEPRPHPKVK